MPSDQSRDSNERREIAFPLGGIGTGTVSLGARGEFRDWEIFNRPSKGLTLPQTFFSVWVRERGRNPIARVVAGRPYPPHTGHSGLPRSGVPGLPHFKSAKFRGTYPTAQVAFEDDQLPLMIFLQALSPFNPLKPEDSGLPVAILRYALMNTSDRAVDATLCLSAMNPIGYLPPRHIDSNRACCFGGNVNRLSRRRGLTAIHMTSERIKPDALTHGSMAIATDFPETTHRLLWGGTGWFDDLQIFWDEFSATGQLANQYRMKPTPDGITEHASLGARLTLEPNAWASVRFFLAWHFPNRDNHWNTEKSVKGAPLRNAYADRFDNALEVVQHTAANLERLESGTGRFVKALFSTTAPRPVLDAVSANISTLRTNSVLWLDDGRMHGFEGCFDDAGCCPMDCTHVWNYSQAEAFLFPTLARSMRETDFGHSVDRRGEMAFRTLIPLGRERWKFRAAADGQCGTIVRLFREWNLSGDSDFLRRHWLTAKRAMEFAIREFDRDGDGVPEAERHNTYDIEFIGPDPLTATMHLAALRAMAEMARAVDDSEMAERCNAHFEKGRLNFEKRCWNGAYFQQDIKNPNAAKYQIGAGCLSDQLLGEWLARTVGLGNLLPERLVKRAAKAIFKSNWKADLTGHVCCQRSYAMEGEPGLLLCTWPRGGRPKFPFPYSDEVWTGVEYATAALMIEAGLIDEGIAIVEGARSRHDGVKRNPWNEPECGHHYVRAMSSWSLITALSGFRCSAPKRMLAFAPRINQQKFQSIWSNGQAWGVYRQLVAGNAMNVEIKILGGDTSIETLEIGIAIPDPLVELNGNTVVAKSRSTKSATRISCQVNLKTDDILTIKTKGAR